MKSILLSALFCSFFFLSCSSDDTIEDSNTKTQAENSKKNYARTATTNVAYNTANAYDTTGDIQYQILNSVIASAPQNTLTNIVSATNTAALNNTGFTAIAPSFTGIVSSQVQWVINCNGNVQTVVSSSGASTAGRAQLTAFLNLMDGAEANEYSDNYTTITQFEYQINIATNLTAADKTIILRTTSIARYLCYYVDDKDRDWHGVKNGLFGAVKGGNTNVQTAIALAVACGIQQNMNE